MILSVSEQVIVFLWTTVSGMAIAFVYDIFRIIRKAVRTGGFAVFVQDILFWLIACIIMFISIYRSNDGELRGFLFFGAFLGAVLYAMLFSKAVMGSSLFIINVTARAVKILIYIVLYPFRFLVKLLSKPVRMAAKAAADSLRMTREREKEMPGSKTGVSDSKTSGRDSALSRIAGFLRKRPERRPRRRRRREKDEALNTVSNVDLQR